MNTNPMSFDFRTGWRNPEGFDTGCALLPIQEYVVWQLAETVRTVHAGNKYPAPDVAARLAEHLGDEALTEREVKVLRLLAAGNRSREISQSLSVSEETVNSHLKHISEKSRASNRTRSRDRHAAEVCAALGK